MSIEKSIGWTDRTINPIKGMCKGGCWYCYTKPLYNTKRLTPEIRLDCSQFSKLPKIPKKIFLCSTHDLFGSWILRDWRDEIFKRMEDFPQHTFQILTKMPENIDRPMPDNAHLGVSITGDKDVSKVKELLTKKAKIKFVSIEPFLQPIYCSAEKDLLRVDWIIAGRLTGHGRKYDPPKEWIDGIIRKARGRQIPIFLKNNLKEICDPLIQEFPE